jgi:hypothetical protein
MSAPSLFPRVPSAQPSRPGLEVVRQRPIPASLTSLRAGFWIAGILLAIAQAWISRYQVSADSISYLDMSDGVLPGSDWHRLINGVWSPLYPAILGVFRRVFNISPQHEIVAGHLLNIAFFLFAFACFEFFLRRAIQKVVTRENSAAQAGPLAYLPVSLYVSLAYSLFLWGSIAQISLSNLRADMLMSGFVYLAIGILMGMQGSPARWNAYIALGLVLGVGVLAKEPLLPLGILIFGVTIFLVDNWRPAVKMVAASLMIFFAIASLYFVPLSIARGHFTLGESGKFNYLTNVNRARPAWYLQTPGDGIGQFLHAPEKIFSSPPAYAFPVAPLVTHPLRFDPSIWVVGAKPRFLLKDQILALKPTLRKIAQLLFELVPVILSVCALAIVNWKRKLLLPALKTSWPIWLIGLAGCALYVPVRVEPRYIGAFLALFWIGLILSLKIPLSVNRKAIFASTSVLVALILLPFSVQSGLRYFQERRAPNADAQAATQLASLGIRPGDKVARISPTVVDLGIERIARVQIAAEVDNSRTSDFWAAPPSTQNSLLDLFASRGIKAVIATFQTPVPANMNGWIHLGSTQYWVWLPVPRQ